MTNATKANVIALINSLFGVLIAFHLVLTQAQVGAISIAVNAALTLYVATTYKRSPKRVG